MITFDSTKMSDDEWHFIRFYCTAVARDYDLIQIVRALADHKFHVKPFYTAVKLGLKLHKLQTHKIEQLREIGKKYGHDLPDETAAPPELIAEVFTQSFFKIVDSETKAVLILDKNLQKHDGWSSGHPNDWQHAIYALQEIHEQKLKTKNTAESIFISALFKLFSILPKGLSPNSWPQPDYAQDEWDDDEEDDYNSGPDYSQT